MQAFLRTTLLFISLSAYWIGPAASASRSVSVPVSSSSCTKVFQASEPSGFSHLTPLSQALFNAILIHDNSFPVGPWPESLGLSQINLRDLLKLNVNLYKETISRKRIQTLIEDINSDLSSYSEATPLQMIPFRLSPSLSQQLKYSRAVFKQLRFTVVLLSNKHKYPETLDKFVKEMGKFQDALKRDDTKGAQAYLDKMKRFLKKSEWKDVEADIFSLDLAKEKSVLKFLRHDLIDLLANLKHATLTAEEFHESRKVISRLVAFYDSVNILSPNQDSQRVLELLSTFNGQMGGMHDILVLRASNDQIDYQTTPIDMPQELQSQLRVFTQWALKELEAHL